MKRKFASQELQDYFNKKTWYVPMYSPDDFDSSVLNDYERTNAEFLNDAEHNMDSDGYIKN